MNHTHYLCSECNYVTSLKLKNPLLRWLMTCWGCNRYTLHRQVREGAA